MVVGYMDISTYSTNQTSGSKLTKRLVSYKKQELIAFRGRLGSTSVFDGIRVAHLFSFMYSVFCFVCFRSVSCVPGLASFLELSILYCLFVFLKRLLVFTTYASVNYFSYNIISYYKLYAQIRVLLKKNPYYIAIDWAIGNATNTSISDLIGFPKYNIILIVCIITPFVRLPYNLENLTN